MDKLVVFSADCHGGASWEGYGPYLPRAFLGEYDTWLKTKYSSEEGAKKWRNAFFSGEYQSEFNAGAAARGVPSNLGWEVPVGGDEDRVRQLEGDGVVAEFIFPDGNRDEPPWRGFMDVERYSPELRAAGAHAWNLWLVDLCSVRPGQHVGGALLDLIDIDAALAEMAWAKGAGLRCVVPGTPPQRLGLPRYGHPRYEPIWSACVDLDLPINFHLGNGGPEVCSQMICSGVFERHPELRVAWTEQGIRWAVTLLRELEALFDEPALRHARAGLSLRPFEYFARNCWLGHSGSQAKEDWDLRFVLGVDRLMWGSDFPHPEGWWPHTTENLRRCFAGFAPDELRLVLGETAVAFYHLDRQQLALAADRVGPNVSDIV